MSDHPGAEQGTKAAGSQPSLSERLGELTNEEEEAIVMYLRIRRFETKLRFFIIRRFKEVYQDEWDARLLQSLGGEVDRLQARRAELANKYGGPVPETSGAAEIMEHLGFEHYLGIFKKGSVWDRCFRDRLTSQEEVVAGLQRLTVVRNEVMHCRASAHPDLRKACLVDMDGLEGQMDSVRYAKLAAMMDKARPPGLRAPFTPIDPGTPAGPAAQEPSRRSFLRFLWRGRKRS